MSFLDDLDIAVLAFVADHPDSTVTDCAKTIFQPENTEELQKKDALLRHRFKALASAGFLVHTSVSHLRDNRTSPLLWNHECLGCNIV